ncbi:MAG: cell wall hydrolase [Lachnospiraceae bacterium]|nr:cell wall hydrolase [Lachnospiraceae bacterium]
MKNRMHACNAAVAVLMVAAVITQGSMQGVWAAGKTITKSGNSVASAKMTVKNTEEADNEEGSTNESSIDIKVGANPSTSIDIKVDSTGNGAKAESTDLSGSVAGIAYENLVMANVEEAVNIRKSDSEDSEIVGKLYKECAGEIIKKGSGWTNIRTGDVTGWVKNDYLLFGADAKRLADSAVRKMAKSTTSCLRVRKEPSQDAGIYDLLAQGDTIEVVEELGEWVSVEFADGTVGYVSSEYVTVSDEIGKGESIESIMAKAEASEKAKQAEANKAAAAKGAAAAQAKPTATTDAAAAAAAATASYDDVTLLAALIQSESGYECHEGQVAVGNVVMNRLRSGKFGNTIYSVINAKGQFSPVGSGRIAQILAQGPKASCIQAAQEAMAGTNYVGDAVRFRPVSSGYQGIVIGNHVFW